MVLPAQARAQAAESPHQPALRYRWRRGAAPPPRRQSHFVATPFNLRAATGGHSEQRLLFLPRPQVQHVHPLRRNPRVLCHPCNIRVMCLHAPLIVSFSLCVTGMGPRPSRACAATSCCARCMPHHHRVPSLLLTATTDNGPAQPDGAFRIFRRRQCSCRRGRRQLDQDCTYPLHY